MFTRTTPPVQPHELGTETLTRGSPGPVRTTGIEKDSSLTHECPPRSSGASRQATAPSGRFHGDDVERTGCAAGQHRDPDDEQDDPTPHRHHGNGIRSMIGMTQRPPRSTPVAA
jgi:hypothetical protein